MRITVGLWVRVRGARFGARGARGRGRLCGAAMAPVHGRPRCFGMCAARCGVATPTVRHQPLQRPRVVRPRPLAGRAGWDAMDGAACVRAVVWGVGWGVRCGCLGGAAARCGEVSCRGGARRECGSGLMCFCLPRRVRYQLSNGVSILAQALACVCALVLGFPPPPAAKRPGGAKRTGSARQVCARGRCACRG